MNNNNNRTYQQIASSTIYNMYISGEIGAAEHYIDELAILNSANEGDVINLRINTPGGSVGTAVQLIAAIRNSSASVVGHLEGECHSAGTIILLGCDEWVINDYSLMLVHNATGGAYGKGNESIQQAQASNAWCNSIMEDLYTGFLTDQEIKDLLQNNKDYWFHTDEILERLEKYADLRNELAQREAEKSRQDLVERLSGKITNGEDSEDCVSASSPTIIDRDDLPSSDQPSN